MGTSNKSVMANFTATCVHDGLNDAGTCCAGTTRCNIDHYCRTSCPTCVASGSNAAGSCCWGLTRCTADNTCRVGCPNTSCVNNGSNAPGGCCAGNYRCDDGYCRSNCPSCVPEGSNANGGCCSGTSRCADGTCRANCAATACVPEGSNAPGNCCSGSRCSDDTCRANCSSVPAAGTCTITSTDPPNCGCHWERGVEIWNASVPMSPYANCSTACSNPPGVCWPGYH